MSSGFSSVDSPSFQLFRARGELDSSILNLGFQHKAARRLQASLRPDPQIVKAQTSLHLVDRELPDVNIGISDFQRFDPPLCLRCRQRREPKQRSEDSSWASANVMDKRWGRPSAQLIQSG